MIRHIFVLTLKRFPDRRDACIEKLKEYGVPTSYINTCYGPDAIHYPNTESVIMAAADKFHSFHNMKKASDNPLLQGLIAQSWGYCEILQWISQLEYRSNIMLIQDRRMLCRDFQLLCQDVGTLQNFDLNYWLLTGRFSNQENEPTEKIDIPNIRRGIKCLANDWLQITNSIGAGNILDQFLSWLTNYEDYNDCNFVYEQFLLKGIDKEHVYTFSEDVVHQIEGIHRFPSALHYEEFSGEYDAVIVGMRNISEEHKEFMNDKRS